MFKISFVKKTQQQTIILAILFISLFMNFWSQVLHLPGAVKFLCDIGWLLLLILIILNRNKILTRPSLKRIGIVLLFFVICVAANYVANYQSILYFVWGFRNLFRFYVFFYACLLFLDEGTINSVIKALDGLFGVNVLLIAVQYFVFKLKGDFLGGLFGIKEGCNGYLNNYFVVMTIIYLMQFYYKKIKLKKAIISMILMLLCCAISEIKIFYIEFILILLLFSLITKFSFKKVLLILTGLVGVLVGINILITLFPNFSKIFTIHNLLAEATSERGYTGENDFNRLNSILLTNRYFFHSTPEKLFGFGLGNCDHADGSALFTTPFYSAYERLHYSWIFYAFLYLELGYIGLAFYYGIFFICGIFLLENSQKSNYDPMYVKISLITLVLMGLLSIYNSSLRIESAYLMFFVLSIGLVPTRSIINHREIEE